MCVCVCVCVCVCMFVCAVYDFMCLLCAIMSSVFEQSIMHLIAALSCRGGGGGGILFSPKIFIFWEKCLF